MAYYEGEIGAIGGNNNGFGNGWEGLIGLALVAGLFDGGFGFGGGRGQGQCATQADLSAGFANSAVLSGINDIQLGQTSMQNWINQGFSGLNLGVERGFAQTNFNLQNCCCETQRAIDGVNYNMATNTCNIIQNQNANTQRILDYLCAEKISAITAENTALKGQISNYNQTNAIVSALAPQPRPAYLVQNPNCCYNPFANNCGCSGIQ